MNLRAYYEKIRDWEGKIPDEFTVIVSQETPDGGRAGERTEVSRRLAARMLVEGQARLETPAEAAAFREERAAAKAAADQLAAAAKVQVTLISAADIEKLKGTSKAKG
jgi:hypothetical protein